MRGQPCFRAHVDVGLEAFILSVTFDGELSLEAFDQLWSGDAFLRELSLRGAFHLGRLVRGQESAWGGENRAGAAQCSQHTGSG